MTIPSSWRTWSAAAAEALGRDERIAWFSVEAASEESIHNHRAFARIESPPRGDGHAWTAGIA